MQRKRKKLLYIVESMGGGVFTYLVNLSNELADRYEIYIAYAVREHTPANYAEYFNKQIRLIRVKNFCREIDLKKDVRAFFEIRRIVKEVNPDVIHLHSSKAGVLGRWAINGKKIPLFYTPHGYSFLMQDHSKEKRSFYRMIEALSAKRRCTTISCSYGEHSETLKMTKRAAYVDNGINIKEMEELLNTLPEPKEHPFTVFTLGRICEPKHPKLFNQIAESMPSVHFLWIGDGELREQLTAPNIEITGWSERHEALSKSINADVFLLTSLWEGLPFSLVEAMFLKKLCIVSNVIGCRDVIQNERNGYVCDSLEDFVSAIQRAQAFSSEDMIKTAYRDVLERYNTGVMAKKYSKLYEGQTL